MIPLIGILLCVYLVFKGFELFQIAYCSQDPPTGAMVIGFVAVLASIVIAGLFVFLFISSAASMPLLPALKP